VNSRNDTAARQQQGFSLIEVLLALLLGLVLVAGVVTWGVAHIGEQRRLIAQARLSLDLRAALDLATRDVRRAGHWGTAERGVWSGADSPPTANPYTGVHPAAGSSTSLGHAYSRDPTENGRVDANERYGLRLNAGTGALEWRMSGAAIAPGTGDQWQALTDPALLQIVNLQITHESDSLSLLAHCARTTCPDPGDATCPPKLVIHRVTLLLEGRDPHAPDLRRSLRSSVRLRNEEVQGACPGV
jgi:prepilin-type N-terminal cleavage/methylation domain-containing protein